MLYITYNIPRPTGYRNDTVITNSPISLLIFLRVRSEQSSQLGGGFYGRLKIPHNLGGG